MPDQDTWLFINTFAPWFSAAGTIAAVATSLYLAQRDRLINLKVRASLRIQLIPGGASTHNDRFVSINVVNCGRRSVTITAIGFRYRTVSRSEFLPLSHQGSPIPAKLEDGDEEAYLYPLEEFCTGLFRNLPAESFYPFPSIRLRFAQVIVATSVGNTVYASFTKDLRHELANRIKQSNSQKDANMNSQVVGLRVAGAIFGLICLGHLLRLLTRAEVLVAGHQIPLWLNSIGFVIAAGLSLWMWKLSYGSSR